MNDPVPPPPAASNVPEYTVSEIAGEVKRMLKGNFVRVLDEITELKRYPSGHLFLAQGRGRETRRVKLAGILWKSAVTRLGMKPENGVEFIAR